MWPSIGSESLFAAQLRGRRFRAGRAHQGRHHDQGILPTTFDRVLETAGDHTQRAGGDGGRFALNENGALPGDHIQNFIEAGVRMGCERLAELKEPGDRIGCASEDRLLERVAPDEILLDKRGN